MNFYPTLWRIDWRNEIDAPSVCSERQHHMATFTIQVAWFELEWWCMDSAGYGALEFRWNCHWTQALIKRLRRQYGKRT